MATREQNIKTIVDRLTYLQLQVKNRNSLNLTDINIHSENFFRDLYNLLGYSFNNTNFDKQNAAHIDLIDSTNKTAIQVTSQNDNEKIFEAIKGFYKDNAYQDYKLRVLLISKDAKNYRTDFTDGGTFSFDHKKDVIDVPRLLAEINDKKNPLLETIVSFLNEEILSERPRTESNEVETIMALIDFLSQDENRTLSGTNENVDPERKILVRFSAHTDFIVAQYQDLYSVYSIALLESRKSIDAVEAIIISSYLKDESDLSLTQNENNPKLALNKLVQFFHEKLSINRFKKFDKQAIRFYLLDEMIRCNVFPNPNKIE